MEVIPPNVEGRDFVFGGARTAKAELLRGTNLMCLVHEATRWESQST